MTATIPVTIADLGPLLIQQGIQITVLIVFVFGLVRLCMKDRPHLAHALWGLVLLKCLTPPLFAFPTSPFSWLQWPGDFVTVASPMQGPDGGQEIQLAERWQTLQKFRMLPGASPSVVDSPIDVSVAQAVADNSRWKAPTQRGVGATDSLSHSHPLPITLDQSHRSEFGDRLGQFSVDWIVIGWLAGVVVCALIAVLRLFRFLYRVRHSRVDPDPSTLQMLDRLLSEDRGSSVAVRARVRVEVIDTLIGPAVVGLLRPRILLPRILETECTKTELRILLAHELSHIRRGDLWWALLQTGARCVWWFHPLVHGVSRWFDRVTEQSCDEESVARLRCRPAEYARGLLSVLERKHLLRSVPALPGVRPVDLTTKRMERIMKLSTDAKVRRPWWIVMVMLVGAACVLPGAALGVADELPNQTEAEVSQNVEAPREGTAELLPKLGRVAPAKTHDLEGADANGLAQIVKIYDATAAIQRIKQEEACDDDLADTILYSSLSTISSLLPGVDSGDRTGLVVDGSRVIVRGNDTAHQRVETELKRIEKFGFVDQIVIETKLATMAADKFSEIEFDWKMVPQQERRIPVLLKLLTADETGKLIKIIEADERSNMLFAPKITVFNGQVAKVTDFAKRPFVVGLGDSDDGNDEAEIRVENDGIELTFCPLMKERSVVLDIQDFRSTISGVGTFSFQAGGKPRTVQVPTVMNDRFQTSISMPRDASLAYVMPNQSDWKEVSIAIVRATPLSEFGPASEPAKPSTPVTVSDVCPDPLAIESTASVPQSLDRVLIKSDGPRMSAADVEALTGAISPFGWIPHLEGTFEYQITDGEIVLRGKNIAISEGSDSLQMTCPSGEIVFDLRGKKMFFRADSVLELLINDSGVRLRGKELSLGENGLQVTGAPLLFEAKDPEIRGESEKLVWGDELLFSGNVHLQAGDTKLSAKSIYLTHDFQTLQLRGDVSLVRKSSDDGSSTQETMQLQSSSLTYELNSGTVSQK